MTIGTFKLRDIGAAIKRSHPKPYKGSLFGTIIACFDCGPRYVYSSRLMDFSSSRKNVSYLYYKSSAAFKKGQQIPRDSCEKITGYDHRFQCQSQSNPVIWYQIDIQVQVCLCAQGVVGKVCKHLIAISRQFGLELFHLPPQTSQSRQRLATVARGSPEQLSFYEQ